MTAPPTFGSLTATLNRQDGVISRVQWRALGLTDSHLRTKLGRGWRRVTVGVFVAHSGELTSQQRQWVAVLANWPAALSHGTVLPGVRLPGNPALVHVAVPSARQHRKIPGVAMHEMLAFTHRLDATASPPRIEAPHALLDVLRDRRLDESAMVGVLFDAIRLGLVSPSGVAQAMNARLRVRARDWLNAVLQDLEAGTESVLEHRFVELVERAHGLPTPIRQARDRDIDSGSELRRDALWPAYRTIVELDGWLYHQRARRDADLRRDLAAAAHQDLLTIRLGWRQVVADPCATAASLAAVLSRRGWRGALTPCPRCR